MTRPTHTEAAASPTVLTDAELDQVCGGQIIDADGEPGPEAIAVPVPGNDLFIVPGTGPIEEPAMSRDQRPAMSR